MGITSAIARVIDGALLLASPSRYRVRKHFQRMDAGGDYAEAFKLGMRLRGYRAARESGSKTPWAGGSSSADAEILRDLPAMRNRSRELNRDDSLGSGLIGTFVNNWIGTGMRPQANTPDLEKNRRIESVWRERADALSPADDLTHPEGQRLIAGKVLEDGEVIRKAVFSGDPVWFETVEADRLATPPQMAASPLMRDGVERDSFGRPVALWIMKSHPGDTLNFSAAYAPENFQRVPVAVARHLKITSRPGQSRGVPLFHAILQDIRDLDLLMIAALQRTQIAACLSIFIKSPVNTEEMMEVTAEKYGYKLDQKISPGMIWKLFPGEEVQTLIPNFPTPELSGFIIMLARRIGAALGISFQMVLKDFSASNYSSARTDLLESRQVFVFLQSWFIEKYLNWEWETVLFDAWLRGDSRLTDVTREELAMVHWIPPGWRWIDPVKEAAQAEIELRIKSTTLRDVCAQKGQDWEEIMTQGLIEEKREMELRAQMGLPARAPVQPAATQVMDDSQDDPQGIQKDKNGGDANAETA